MNLADTSVWIALLAKRDVAETRLLRHWLMQDAACVTPVIVQELLQGARGEQELSLLESRFMALPMLIATPDTFARAGGLYARCRWKGITIRSPHDCLIAATAVEHDVPLLSFDRDFKQLARIEPGLRLVKP